MEIKNSQTFNLIKAIKKTNNEILKQESDLVRRYSLTASQYGVLECLYLKGDMHINDLIRRLISTSGTMTVIVRNLEKLGYVTKKLDIEDKRYFKIGLTNQGKALVEKILPERKKQLNDFTSIFTEDEKDDLLNISIKLSIYFSFFCELFSFPYPLIAYVSNDSSKSSLTARHNSSIASGSIVLPTKILIFLSFNSSANALNPEK